MIKIHLDFETRSVVNLKIAGAHVYSEHPTTDALCMSYAIGDEAPRLWKLGQPFPIDLAIALDEGGYQAIAHNAPFEKLIWKNVCVKKYGWPELPTENLYCNMVMSYSMGLPGALEMTAHATSVETQKDMKGSRVMLQLAQPRSGPEKDCWKCQGEGWHHHHTTYAKITCECVVWWEIDDSTPKLDIAAKYETLYKYCLTDAVVERQTHKKLLPLSQKERNLWLLDQKINDRGVFIDIPAVKRALLIIEVEQARLNSEMQKITQGQVSGYDSVERLCQWINSKGVDAVSVAKDKVLDLLDQENLPMEVRTALLIRQEAAKSSTAKLLKMIEGTTPEIPRARGCFQFYGAFATGRWAGRRIQLHNLPRPKLEQYQIDDIFSKLCDEKMPILEVIEYISIFYGPVLPAISDCLRGFIRAPKGKKLAGCDLSSIEARVLAWLAGEEKKLEIFRTHGLIYEDAACKIYNLNNLADVSKWQRLIGKVSELALGYQGGVGAFQSMAKNYFIKVPNDQAEQIKLKWREANPNIVKYWHQLEDAALYAVKYPGKKYFVGPKGREVCFLVKGSFLFCRLPSGRPIVYPFPKIQQVETPWGAMKEAVTYMAEQNYQWERVPSYGGLFCENICQASARDILAEAMPRWEQAEYPLVLHVHDELVGEVDENFGSVELTEKLTCIVPDWAQGLPIGAEGWEGERYRK